MVHQFLGVPSLLMAEIRRAPVEGTVVYPTIYRGFIHPRWLARFQPSTVPPLIGTPYNGYMSTPTELGWWLSLCVSYGPLCGPIWRPLVKLIGGPQRKYVSSIVLHPCFFLDSLMTWYIWYYLRSSKGMNVQFLLYMYMLLFKSTCWSSESHGWSTNPFLTYPATRNKALWSGAY